MSVGTKNTWTAVGKILAVVAVVALGMWCLLRKPGSGVSVAQVRSLEASNVKLDQDYRKAALERDKARRELATLEEESLRQQRDLADREALIKERDELRRQASAAQGESERLSRLLTQRTNERDDLQKTLNIKTAERDTVTGRYERLRKTLQTIVAQDDGGAPNANPVPVNAPVLDGSSGG